MLLALRLVAVFVVGTFAGAAVNWASRAFAWQPSASKGRGLRPQIVQFGLGLALTGLYWWEVVQHGLIVPQLAGLPVQVSDWAVHWEFLSHALLIGWMLAASLIDIDEKIIPDEITVSGTLLGLLLAAIVPLSLLPHVADRPAAVGVPLAQLQLQNGIQAVGPRGNVLAVEPMTAVSPNEWPPIWGRPRAWQSLAIALGCYWLWCFALAPRIWRGRRGTWNAMRLICARVWREFARPPMRLMLVSGTVAIIGVWWLGVGAWAGVLTALIGLVGSGGIVWAVRLIGTAALRREAMGFGDVTLMMMVGTFLGWQACLIAFFLAPFAGLVIGILQFAARRDDVIPYGPFLCLASAAVIAWWGTIWMWAQPMFEHSGLVPAVLVICLAMLGIMLAIWQMIKTAIFGRPAARE